VREESTISHRDRGPSLLACYIVRAQALGPSPGAGPGKFHASTLSQHPSLPASPLPLYAPSLLSPSRWRREYLCFLARESRLRQLQGLVFPDPRLSLCETCCTLKSPFLHVSLPSPPLASPIRAFTFLLQFSNRRPPTPTQAELAELANLENCRRAAWLQRLLPRFAVGSPCLA